MYFVCLECDCDVCVSDSMFVMCVADLLCDVLSVRVMWLIVCVWSVCVV